MRERGRERERERERERDKERKRERERERDAFVLTKNICTIASNTNHEIKVDKYVGQGDRH